MPPRLAPRKKSPAAAPAKHEMTERINERPASSPSMRWLNGMLTMTEPAAAEMAEPAAAIDVHKWLN